MRSAPERPHQPLGERGRTSLFSRLGQGIGSALVRALLADARAMGFERVWFGTDGPGFYERLGARRHLQRSTEFWTMCFELGPTAAQPSG